MERVDPAAGREGGKVRGSEAVSKPSRNLHQRLSRYKTEILRFLLHIEVSFDK